MTPYTIRGVPLTLTLRGQGSAPHINLDLHAAPAPSALHPADACALADDIDHGRDRFLVTACASVISWCAARHTLTVLTPGPGAATPALALPDRAERTALSCLLRLLSTRATCLS